MPEPDVPQAHKPTAASQARLNDLAGYFSRRAKLADKYNIRHDEMRELDAEVDMALTAALLRESPHPDGALVVGAEDDVHARAAELVNLSGNARLSFVRWVPASEGEPPVTDTRFAVLLISGEEVDFTSDERKTIHFLRPHYPGAKKPVPADCHWLLLPPIPETA